MFPSYSQYGELDALADDLEYRAALARQQAALQRGVAPQPPRVRRAQPQPRMRPAPVPRYIPRPEVEPYDYGFQMEEAPYEYAYTPTPTRYPVAAAAPVYEPYGVPPVYQSGYGRPRPIPRVAAAYEPEDAIPVYDRSRQAPSYPQYYEDEDDGEDYSDVPPPLIPISPRAVVPRRQPVPRAPAPREAPVLRQRQPAPRRVSFEPSYEEEEEQQPQRSPSHARQDSASPPNTVQDIASILGQLLGGARQTQSQPQQQPERRPEPSSTQPSITDVLGQVLGSVMQQIQQPQQQPQRPQPQAPRTRAVARQDAMARASQGFRDALAQRTRAAAPPSGPVEESPMTWADYLDSSCGQWQPAPAQRQRAVPQTAPALAPRQPPAAPAQPEEAQAPSLQDFLANIIHLAAQHSQQQQNPEPQSQAQSELPPSLMRSAQPQPHTRAQPQPQAQPAQQKTSSTPAHAQAQAPVESKTSYTYAAPASAQPAAIPHPHPHPKPHSSSPALPIPGRAYQHIPHNLRDPDAQAQAQGIRKAGVADEVADIKEAIRRSLADRAGVEVHGPQQAPSAASPAAACVNANSHVNSHPHNTSTATAAATSSSSAKKSSIEGAVTTDSRAPTEPVHEGSESESPTPASAAAAHLAQIAKIEERFVNLSYDFNFPAAPEFSPSALASSASSPTSASAPSLAYTHVNQPIRAYELALTGLLTDLDAVESAGDEEVRHARKELVERIEGALEALERQKDEAWAKVSAASSPVSATAPVVLEPKAEVAREASKEDAVSQPASEEVVEQQAAASDEGYVIPSEPEPEVVVVEDANTNAPVADATDVEPAKVVSDPEFVSPAPLLHDSEDVMVTQAQPLPASQLQSVESESSAAAVSSPDNRAIPALDENPSGTPSDAHEDVDVTVSTPPAASAMTPAPSRSLAEIDQPAVSYAAVAAGASPSTSIGTADSASSSSSSYPPVPPTSPSASANPAKDSFHDEPSAQTPYVNNEEPEEEEPEHVIDSLGSSPVDIPSELDSDFDEEAPRRVADNGVQKEKEAEVIPPSMEEAAEVESKTEFVML